MDKNESTQTETAPPGEVKDNGGTPPNDQAPEKDPATELEKWKHFARLHETNWQKATRELDELRKANMTDAERAVAEAEERGRRAALAETAKDRAQTKLEAAAAKAGVDITPLLDKLDVTKFLSDGNVNDQAIGEFVASFPSAKQPKFPQGLGIGPQSGTSAPGQLTRSDLKGMSPRDIEKAHAEGRLDALMRGEI